MLGGQWIGRFAGTNSGLIVVDVDDVGDHFRGRAYVFDDAGLPGFTAPFVTPDKESKQSLSVGLQVLHPKAPNVISAEDVAKIAPGTSIPQFALVSLEATDSALEMSWGTPVGTFGSATLEPSRASYPSEIVPEADVRTWDQFKQFAVTLTPETFVFRGQDKPYRLRTAFHRTLRKDLVRYMMEDIPALHRALSARMRHVFDLNEPIQNAAFWNLAQHHGYPTPLLDWTRSPFVAAYFAFRTARVDVIAENRVRILMFDEKKWRQEYMQLQTVINARPHFSMLEALAIGNERALPQQSLSTATNVDDIETYLLEKEQDKQSRYLRAFDLPAVQREEVLRELRLMGISAGSMFPGLDGACEDQRIRFFGA